MFFRSHLGTLTNLRSHEATREASDVSNGPSEITVRVLGFQIGIREPRGAF